jgi:hypothetical protein
MKKTTLLFLLPAALLLGYSEASAQLGALKRKAAEIAEKALEKKAGGQTEAPNTTASGSESDSGNPAAGSKGRPVNKGGGGLKNSTAPDVTSQISEAEQAFNSGKYSDARFSIQQALLGVELQMGKEILRSLPETVSNLPKDSTQDRVNSSQWGWANLTIFRAYLKDDQQLSVTIGNNALYSGMLDVYFNSAYAQSDGENQNMKRIKVKDNKAAIKYDDSEGYTVLIPLGQSGLITFQGINFNSEDDMMAAVNTFDINGIKKMLGEQ